MRFEATSEIALPRDLVFEIYRDQLVALVPYLPNIRSITVKSRTEQNGLVVFENLWQGGGELPAVVRPFVPGDATGWTDFARWDPVAFTCAWRTEAHAFREAVTADGVNRYEAVEDNRTRVVVSGRVDVDPARVKGVPRLLAGTVRPAIEQFVIASVKSNVAAVSQGVARYVRDQRQTGK